MKHHRHLAGMILILVLALTGCGSYRAVSATAGHHPAKAEPGHPVPVSAIHRLTAIADRAVTADGGHPVEWAIAVVTTHAKALTAATPGDTAPTRRVVVYLVTIKGHFRCDLCTGPPGSRAPTGTYMSLVIDAKTFKETDFGLGTKPPPVFLTNFGPVTHLKVHPLVPHSRQPSA
jgi:hypothetical protein